MANPPPSSTTLSDNDRMMEMINGYWITQIVNAAATYALADHLAKGPAAAAEIAEMANTDPSATFRLLRACASLGLVTYDGECRFTATSLLNTLRTDNAQSLRDLAMLMAGPGNWLPWGRFVDCVKTGEPQAVAALGKMVFEYIAERPAESQTFTRAMKRAITFVTEEVARILDTHSATVIADIGGAGGSLLHAVLQANPAPSGIVFDLPNIAEIAKWATAEIGLERRVTSVGGDFFEAVPAADLYLPDYGVAVELGAVALVTRGQPRGMGGMGRVPESQPRGMGAAGAEGTGASGDGQGAGKPFVFAVTQAKPYTRLTVQALARRSPSLSSTPAWRTGPGTDKPHVPSTEPGRRSCLHGIASSGW